MVSQTGHGIANYLLDLLSGLKKLQVSQKLPYELFLLVSPQLPKEHVLRHYPLEVVEAPFLHPSELWFLPKILARLEASLYFSPSFSSLLHYPCPHMQTVHDLNHLSFGSWKEKLYYRFVLKKSAQETAALFTVSETAKTEISAWLGTDKKIEITSNAVHLPEAVSAAQEKEVLAKFGVEKERYFFCLANPKPHKNLDFLKRAYEKYSMKKDKALPLLLSVEGKN
jgi:glycosyltransferase involved in cell wall biosynthesis